MYARHPYPLADALPAFCQAVRLSPEHIGGDDRTRRLTSLRYYWSSRRSILIATAIQSESLELVITRLLVRRHPQVSIAAAADLPCSSPHSRRQSSRYLIMVHDRRLTECWSQLGASLRTAQAIGLHRDGTKLGLDAFQTEYRRRIWSYLYHADRTYSLILGRPPAISDVYTDTLCVLPGLPGASGVQSRPSTDPPPSSPPARHQILRTLISCRASHPTHGRSTSRRP